MASTVQRIVASASAALALAGAGAGTAAIAAAGHGPQVVRVAADPNGRLAFVQKKLTARPGRSTFVFTNRSKVPHDLSIKRAGTQKTLASTRIIEGGRSARISLVLRKGTYTYDCTVPGHAAAGMKGVLTVS